MKLLDAVLARPVATIDSSGALLSPPAPFKALEQRAIEVAALFDAPSIALKLLDDDPQLGTAVERLVDGGHLGEARRLLSYGMERRDSIWWAYLCATEAIRHKERNAKTPFGPADRPAWQGFFALLFGFREDPFLPMPSGISNRSPMFAASFQAWWFILPRYTLTRPVGAIICDISFLRAGRWLAGIVRPHF